MSVQDIQGFLNARVPTCDTNHAAGPNAGGSAPPWRCLKDYYENPDTGANNLNGAANPAGSISAAQIIWNYAQQYGINPQVLLVTLQKENGLITDPWPYPNQYRTAMGFACPDNGSCDPAYFGFAKQVYQAARHFRNFFDENPNWTVPYKVGSRYVRYHPNSACGGTNVNIQTHGTAALYDYTPYQPNAAALAAGLGTGDACSSYGNRNFSYFFNLWFGTTLGRLFFGGYNWHAETLDGAADAISTTTAQTGQTPATVTHNGVLHTFYYEATGGNLRHAYADATGWHFETLDGEAGASGRTADVVGYQVTAILVNDAIHLFYHDGTTKSLRHAYANAADTNWQFEVLDGQGGKTGSSTNAMSDPTAIAYGTSLQVFYYDATNGNLRHAWINTPTDTWKFEDLDGSPNSVARLNTNVGLSPTVTIFGTSLQLYYYDATNGNLRHAWTSPVRGWQFENLDGDPGSVGRLNSNVGAGISIVADDSVQKIAVLYYDFTYGNLRSAISDSLGWRFANLEGDIGSVTGYDVDIGNGISGAFFNGTLQLYSYDATRHVMRHVWGTQ